MWRVWTQAGSKGVCGTSGCMTCSGPVSSKDEGAGQTVMNFNAEPRPRAAGCAPLHPASLTAASKPETPGG